MNNEIITSCNLCSVPFLGLTDTTRLQMASKQLGQSLSSLNCEVPKVLGSEFRYLSNTVKYFKLIAEEDGQLYFKNDDYIIILYNSGIKPLRVYNVPWIKVCSGLNATRLRYCREEGSFKKGDLIYEYDSFKEGLPCYGYNTWTMYTPFFGLNHEDAIVVSEALTNRCKSIKYEPIIIPIYTHSLFKKVYNSELEFIPDIGHCINNSTVAMKSISINDKNMISILKTLNITDFSSIFEDTLHFTTIPITSRIKNGVVSDIRIHRIDTKTMIDRNLQSKIEKYYSKNIMNIQSNLRKIAGLLGKGFARDIASQQYYILNNVKKLKYNTKDLLYIIELELYNESTSHMGDKMANRYANKGVISFIIPNELRPVALHSNKYIDYISGTISVLSRMNFGQIPEGLVAKAITKAEEIILHNPNKSVEVLQKVSKLAEILGDVDYSSKINQLSREVSTNNLRRDQLLSSIRSTGLYFEAPNFSSFDMSQLETTILKEFNVAPNEPVLIKRDLLLLLKEKFCLNVDVPIPKNDIVLKDIFVAPIYVLKLKQEADSRLTSRDFGAYNAINKQPKQGRGRDGTLAQGSKLGQMEFILAPSYSNICRITL